MRERLYQTNAYNGRRVVHRSISTMRQLRRDAAGKLRALVTVATLRFFFLVAVFESRIRHFLSSLCRSRFFTPGIITPATNRHGYTRSLVGSLATPRARLATIRKNNGGGRLIIATAFMARRPSSSPRQVSAT